MIDAFKLDLNVVGIKFQCVENQLHVIKPKPITRRPKKIIFKVLLATLLKMLNSCAQVNVNTIFLAVSCCVIGLLDLW
jgi:hypothetical protein